MRAHSRPLVVAGETRKQILRLIVAAARKLAFVGPKAMLFGMPVAEKLQSAMGLQCRLDERHLRPMFVLRGLLPCARGRTQPSRLVLVGCIMNLSHLRYAQDNIPQTRTLYASPRKQRSVHLASQGRVMTSFRAVRLGLDYFASLQGRKHAQELCLLYGRGPLPRTLLDGARLKFRKIARSALEEARLEGDQDALLVHLLELWQMNFTLEIKRQRRKSAQTSENRRGRRL